MEQQANQTPKSTAQPSWFVTTNGRKSSTPMSEEQARAEAARLRQLQEGQGGNSGSQFGVAQTICG